MNTESIAAQIVHSAVKVHKVLGPGLLESVYQKCLTYELEKSGRKVTCEVLLPVRYEDVQIDAGFRVDMLVDDIVMIENKTVEKILPIHTAQLLTYLKLSNLRLGFLLNWNVTLMKDGIKPLINSATTGS
jgi:GxxExxY protein